MEYGDSWDWLLCLGIAISLGVRLSVRNPEGHTPKWWRRHRGALARRVAVEALGNMPPARESNDASRGAFRFVGEMLWRWDVVAAGSVLFYGAGVGAMYADDYFIARCLYFVAVSWTTARVLAWEETKAQVENVFEWGGFYEIPETFAVTVGNLTAEMKMSNLKKWGKLIPFSTNGVTPIVVTPGKNGEAVFNFTAWAGGGPIAIENNKVRISDPLLDRNFSKNALEIVASNGDPVFQVIRENASHITVYGIFWPNIVNSSGLQTVWCFDNKHQLWFGRTQCPADFKLKPIFKYPAWKYPGQYAD